MQKDIENQKLLNDKKTYFCTNSCKTKSYSMEMKTQAFTSTHAKWKLLDDENLNKALKTRNYPMKIKRAQVGAACVQVQAAML